MLNQVVLVGTLVKNPVSLSPKDNKAVVTMAINRSFKNVKTGEYDTDYINCILWEGVAKKVIKYCSTGSVVAVKGSIKASYQDFRYDNIKRYPELVGEHVTLLSSNENTNDDTE